MEEKGQNAAEKVYQKGVKRERQKCILIILPLLAYSRDKDRSLWENLKGIILPAPPPLWEKESKITNINLGIVK